MSRAAVPLATVLMPSHACTMMPSHACTTAGDKTSDMMALASFSSRFRRVNASQPNHSSCPLVLSNLQGYGVRVFEDMVSFSAAVLAFSQYWLR